MDPADIQGTTDEELLAFCRPTRVEQLLPRLLIPAVSALALGLVAAVAYATFTDGSEGAGALVVGVVIIVVALGLGVFGVLAGASYLVGLTERRSAGQRAELLRRYGQAGFDADLRQASERGEQDGSPDYTIYLSGTEVPAGRIFWGKLELNLGADAAPGVAMVESRVGPPIDFLHDDQPLGRVARRQATYQLARDAELLTFLEDLELDRLRSVKSCYINGMPCEIALIRRGGGRVYRGGCNYMEQDDRVETAPVMRLVGIMLNLMRVQTREA